MTKIDRKYVRSDFHNHTIYSDGCITIEDLVQLAQKMKFRVVTKTDHDTTNGNLKLKKLAEKKDLIFIPGVEITTKNGHLLAYNVSDWNQNLEEKTMQEVIEIVLDLGGVPVAAHPNWRGGLGESIFNLKGLKGYEVMNNASIFGSLKLLRNSRKKAELYQKFSQYAGSDSHGGIAYGHYFTQIDVEDYKLEDIIEGMFKMRTHYFSPLLPLYMLFKDGMRNQGYQFKRFLNRS